MGRVLRKYLFPCAFAFNFARRKNSAGPNTNKNVRKMHMERCRDYRWKIIKILPLELSNMVKDEKTPFKVLDNLKKQFVSNTQLACVQ